MGKEKELIFSGIESAEERSLRSLSLELAIPGNMNSEEETVVRRAEAFLRFLKGEPKGKRVRVKPHSRRVVKKISRKNRKKG